MRGGRVWLSELLGMPALGLLTIEEWWRRFSNGFDPTLTEGAVLAGREAQAAGLLRAAIDGRGSHVYQGRQR